MKKKGCFLPKFRFYQQSHHNLQGFTPLEILSAMFHTRVSQSKNDSRWHTGHTKDLRKRFNEHNPGIIFSPLNHSKRFLSLTGFTPLEILDGMFYTYVLQSKKDGKWYTGSTKDLRKRQRRFLSLTGFTLTEILIAMVILASATVGLFASFVAAQKYVARSRHRLAAANAGRIVLDDLRAYVNQSTWDDPANLLACSGGTYPCTRPYTLPALDYPSGPPFNWSATYIVNTIDVSGIQMRQVTVNIHWDEPVS